MRAADLLSGFRATPFVPFRIRLNSGRVFHIRHPEMLRVGLSSVNVYSFSGEPSDPFERMAMASLVLIESVEQLEVAHPT